ncbi:hypothetical protein EST38_g8622 [Candolleomyces aberdarensis]|uniref:Protein kinase domain-containing protein n=1 Tax=Candolleomyces aberdarensis TaxID=2316362 RepID=A0A4Q2DDU4_9AGAR|nr:hypothetical protein EST38_g8622 [Candolleomyces aberdarensis]
MADRPGSPVVSPDVIAVNWSFMQENSPAELVDISPSEFTSCISSLRPLFAQELLQKFDFKANTSSKLKFYKPARTIVEDPCQAGFTWTGKELREIPPSRSLSFYISDIVEKQDLIHLVVSAQPADARPKDDVPSELAAFRRYNKIIQTPGLLPSQAARSTEYAKGQAKSVTAIHDGRQGDNASCRIAPPLELYHCIFRRFLRRLLAKILGCSIDSVEEPDTTTLDGMYAVRVEDVLVSFLIIELKGELGDSGSDPTTQAGLSMKHTWIQDDARKLIRERSCCPTFLIAGGGPWFTIMGGVFTDKVIVQRLTEMMWFVESSTEEAERVYNAARVFSALRISLGELKKYYEDIATDDNTPPLVDSTHPRFFPYPTRYTDRLTSEKVDFSYVKPLGESDDCVTFLAKTTDTSGDFVVVKFVSRYGAEVHDFLAQKGHAPRLRYHGTLDDDDMADDALERGIGQPPDGLFVGPLKMVVMDYIETPKTLKISERHRKQVEEILRLIHPIGYVFGDLRAQNVLLDIQDKVKLIDFNWAGGYNLGTRDQGSIVPEDVQQQIDELSAKANAYYRRSGGGDGGAVPAAEEIYAHYPYNINSAIKWHTDVGPMKPIRPEHDWFMLGKLS